MNKKKRKIRWRSKRHSVVWFFLQFIFVPAVRIKYGAHVRRCRELKKEPCLILYNHVTAYDQFFVGVSFRRPVYYVATEDIFSMGFASKLIKYLVAPIPIKKHSTDIQALKTMISVAREGGTIAIAPEGNRTYSGRTCNMKPSIATLCKKLKLPIAFYKIEGGYGVQPRWSDIIRKGYMDCGVIKVMYPEEYKDMTEKELFEVIKQELFLDEARGDSCFKSSANAEYLERAIYVCPECGLSSFFSKGHIMCCKGCGLKVRYNDDTSLSIVYEGDAASLAFKYVADWYDYQNRYVNSLDLTQMTDSPLYEDAADLYEVAPYKKKFLVQKKTAISLYGDRVVLHTNGEEIVLSFSTLSGAACMGRNKLNLESSEKLYQIKGDSHFNALKYVNFYYRYKNIIKGDNNEFLGL